MKTGLPVLLDVSVARNAEIAVSAEAEQVAAFAFELAAVDVSETALLWYPLLLIKNINFRSMFKSTFNNTNKTQIYSTFKMKSNYKPQYTSSAKNPIKMTNLSAKVVYANMHDLILKVPIFFYYITYPWYDNSIIYSDSLSVITLTSLHYVNNYNEKTLIY